MESTNPLAQYFRTPAVQQVIPSGGRFLPEGELTTAINGELAIYPMTASDEIVLKNPDSLLNGDALIRLFHSCVPGIKNPRNISVPDLDVLLLAIKLASYGENLELGVRCPACEKEFETTTNIRGLLAGIKEINEDDTFLRFNDDLVLYLKPYNFESKTTLDIVTFEETKMAQHLLDVDMSDDDRVKMFNRSFEKIADLNLDLVADCIVKIRTPTSDVTEKEFIREFVRNSPAYMVKKIREKLTSMNENGLPDELDCVCPDETCGHEWKTPMIFDPSHFFA